MFERRRGGEREREREREREKERKKERGVRRKEGRGPVDINVTSSGLKPMAVDCSAPPAAAQE
jgi:hypothetical protein